VKFQAVISRTLMAAFLLISGKNDFSNIVLKRLRLVRPEIHSRRTLRCRRFRIHRGWRICADLEGAGNAHQAFCLGAPGRTQFQNKPGHKPLPGSVEPFHDLRRHTGTGGLQVPVLVPRRQAFIQPGGAVRWLSEKSDLKSSAAGWLNSELQPPR
jgi:hypothetical protein